MNKRSNGIDFVKLALYILKRAWFVVFCAEIGFGAVYLHTTRELPETYTATGTMYVNNANPNMTEYQYTNYNDLNTALKLIDTYLVVIRSDQVMNKIVDKLSVDYPGITSAQVSPTLSMASVSETGVVSVISKTSNPKLAADIVNAVLDVAPEEIIRVVGAGIIEVMDYAKVPIFPDDRGALKEGMKGGIYGVVLSCIILAILFMFNQRVTDNRDLTDNYKIPVLASVKRSRLNSKDPNSFKLTDQSPMEMVENYAKLRMNLLHALVGRDSKSVVITSSISGEGKSTIASNLAISCAKGGKNVLLIDGDLRRASQREIFSYDINEKGLSDILSGTCKWQDAILCDVVEALDILPAGQFPSNPAELLGSNDMAKLLKDLEQTYDLIILDMPPINVVADPLAVSGIVAGCVFVVRQEFSDQRDIRKALLSAEMTGMDVLGFVFYGENANTDRYYSKRYYKKYYSKYDYRNKVDETKDAARINMPISHQSNDVENVNVAMNEPGDVSVDAEQSEANT